MFYATSTSFKLNIYTAKVFRNTSFWKLDLFASSDEKVGSIYPVGPVGWICYQF
jgi:hypothetical protein